MAERPETGSFSREDAAAPFVTLDVSTSADQSAPSTMNDGISTDGPADALASDGSQSEVEDAPVHQDSRSSPSDVEIPTDAGPDLGGAMTPAPDAQPQDMGRRLCAPNEARDCGRNVGRCRAGRQVCQADGTFGPCMGETLPSEEICNGQDDDCNGVTDDSFNIGDACVGIGICGPGLLECRGNLATRCSTDQGGSRAGDVPETCDGTDEDCDGRSDEDFMVGSACLGRCGAGRQECAAAGDLVCSTDPGGSGFGVVDETCNGLDDNCDGQLDEGFRLGVACEGVGACGAGVRECDLGGSGVPVCSSEGGGTASEAAAERCDGLDNDCDGQLDEDFAVGAPCDGVGECGDGTTECAEDGRLICSTDPGGSQSADGRERCDGRDDDCDGQVDEGLNLGDVCPAVGVCSAGRLECSPDFTVVCSTAPGASQNEGEAEACNGIDDDCDGRADEDFEIGGACDGQGDCGVGVWECRAEGVLRCSTEPGGTADQARAEGCDGIDNDCDGAVDDGAACGGDTCGTASGLLFTEGVTGNTTGLVNDYDSNSCLGQTSGNDQVYRFDTPAAGRYAIGLAPLAANYDALFWVTADCDHPDTCVQRGGRDLAASGRPEARAIDIPWAGAFYTIVDGRVGGGGGPYLLMVRPMADGEHCGSPIPLSIPGRFVGTTEGRTNDVAGQACPAAGASTGPDQVFALTPARAGRLNVALTPGPDIRFILSLTTTCALPDQACAGSAIAAQNGQMVQLAANVEADTTYYLIVDHLDLPGGAFVVDLSLQ